MMRNPYNRIKYEADSSFEKFREAKHEYLVVYSTTILLWLLWLLLVVENYRSSTSDYGKNVAMEGQIRDSRVHSTQAIHRHCEDPVGVTKGL